MGPRTPKPTHLCFGRARQHLPGDLISLNSALAENPLCGCITFAAAEGAVEKLAVHVVALAVGAVDLPVGHVTGVADALPAHAVPQPRADDRAVVPPAAALQLLAGLAFCFALAVLPHVAGVAAAIKGEERCWASSHKKHHGACVGPRPQLKRSKSGTASLKPSHGVLVQTPCWSRVADQEETSETPFSVMVVFTTPNSCPEIVIFIISKPLPRRSECFLRKPSLFLSLSLRGHEATIALKDLHELQPRSGILKDFYRNLCPLSAGVG